MASKMKVMNKVIDKYFYSLKNFDVNAFRDKFLETIQNIKPSLVGKFRSFTSRLNDVYGTNFSLALYHLFRENYSDAIFRFKLIKFLTEETKEVNYFLIDALLRIGESDSAKKLLLQLIQKNSKEDIYKFLDQRVNSPEQIKLLPLNIIEMNKLFYESIALKYDRHLIESKGYVLHKKLIKQMLSEIDSNIPNLKVLDLGCGTGLCGQEIFEKDIVKQLDGVDFSEQMVFLSEGRIFDEFPVYDHIEAVSIEDYLVQNKKKNEYDAVTACDVLHLCNNLDGIFEGVSKKLKKNGLFAFSLDIHNLNDFQYDSKTNSFIYSEEYIKNLAKKKGFDVLQLRSHRIFSDSKYKNSTNIIVLIKV